MEIGNLFSEIPGFLPEERFEDLASSKSVKIERIISRGHATPEGFWYDQSENEWVLVVKGEAQLQIWGEPEPITLAAGMYVNLPAHVKHRVEWTTKEEETIWLAIFY